MDGYGSFRSSQDGAPMSSRHDSRWANRDEDPYARRSPGPSDRRYRYRGRSRSPPTIDRYQPDGHYGGFPREREPRRRPPSPGPANIDRYVPSQDFKQQPPPPPPPPAVNPVPDPNKLEYHVGFSYFGEWWRHDQFIKEERERQRNGGRRPLERAKGDREPREERAKEKAQIQAAYDTYKEAMQVKMAKAFVQSHRAEEWFKERYVPAIRDDIRTRLTEVRRGHYGLWEREFDAGAFDDFSLEGVYKGDSNAQGGPVEKEEGETVATAEVLGIGDLLPSKPSVVRDEAAHQPALLIKTIAPSVSRASLEDFCREHLGESAGGLKWLGLSDPNPSKRYHRIGWVMLHPGAEPVVDRMDMLQPDAEPVERTDQDDGRGQDSDEDGERKVRRVQDVGTAPDSVAHRALEAIDGKTIRDEVKGDFTVHVGLQAPLSDPKQKALWDLFSVPERIERDLQLASRVVFKLDSDAGPDFNGIAKVDERVDRLRANGQLRSTTTTTTTVTTTTTLAAASPGSRPDGARGTAETDDAANVDNADPAEAVDDEKEEGAFDEEDDDDDDDDEKDDEELLATKKKLDLLVEYLRRVHNFCFFCVFESDSVHELLRKCPGGHLRRPRATLSSSAKAAAVASVTGQPYLAKADGKEDGDSAGSFKPRLPRHGSKNEQQLSRALNWVKTYEEKILQILEPENVDLRKLGGKPIEDALDEELSKHVRQEDESKFRCKVSDCTKLFKAEHFWRKHAEKRHAEWYEGVKQDLELVNSYVLDPAHISPTRSDPSSNGHFPNSHQQSGGAPRGFHMSNVPMNFNAALPGGGIFPGSNGLSPFFPPQVPGPWMSPGPDFGMGGGVFPRDERHHPGPVRRGGGMGGGGFRHGRMGPYDRRPRDGRDTRWGGGGAGRLTPPRGGGPGFDRGGGGSGVGGGGPGGMGPGGGPGGFAGLGGKWGDGAGVAAAGPREAVQGRSIKSYEDLDAVGNGGGAELNY